MLASFHEQINQTAQSSTGSINEFVGAFRYINPADEHKRRWVRELKSAPKEMEDLRNTLDDFTVFCIRNLKIKTKAGTLEPLVLNAAQKKYAATVFEQLKQGKPVCIIILKARQMGFSTVTEALFYYLSSLQEAKNAFIVAQDS